ncbi:MAG: glycosyltransferase family 39 protein [Pseudomonadota bacterium]|nr:glycosyltransferase family 39 protein [Pseudomonadota bacterium]
MIAIYGFFRTKRTDENRRPPTFDSTGSNRLVFAALLLAAVLIRCIQYGNPVIQIDEQFYLLVGDRMLQGQLPYIQFWDRKPFGLFAIYAAIRSLGGDGILIYQLIATLVAATTAFVVYRIARHAAGLAGAVFSALVYLCYLSVNGGDGGQSPVFYSLLVAIAGLSIFRAIEDRSGNSRSMIKPLLAFLLLGLALQIKYTVVFEGIYFGLFIFFTYFIRKKTLFCISSFAILSILLAVLPTMLIAIYYWHIGHFQQFWFCNFQSILLRPAPDWSASARRLLVIAVRLVPIAIPAALAARHWRRLGPVGMFVGGWCVVSVLAVLVFGTYYDHYALPIVLPFAIMGAPVFDKLKRSLRLGRLTVPIGVMVLAAGEIYVVANTLGLRLHRGNGNGARRIAAIIRPDADRCAFVFAGDPIVYYLSGACIPTVYNFPTLFSETSDSVTLGIDWRHELRRTLDTRPGHIVLLDRPPKGPANAEAWQMVREELRRHYILVDREKLASRTDLLFARRDLLRPNPPQRSKPTGPARAR